MPDDTYNITQDADTVIVLRYSCNDFANWLNNQRNNIVSSSDDDTPTLEASESSASGLISPPNDANEEYGYAGIIGGLAAIKLHESGGIQTASLPVTNWHRGH